MTYVFSGPTISSAEVAELCPGAVILPPIGHGDLFRLAPSACDRVLIIDGRYHQSAAIRHKEILHFIDKGVAILGSSSMGALRAAELDQLGMVGCGTVYSWYRDGVVSDDAEVAVVESGIDRTSLSLPLVNLRWALERSCSSGTLDARDAAQILATGQRLHYTERTWRSLAHAVDPSTPELAATVRSLGEAASAEPNTFDLKKIDAHLALASVRSALPNAQRPTPVYVATHHAEEWRRTHSGRTAHGEHVPDEYIDAYLRLYGYRVPARWRSLLLDRIAEVGPGPVEPRALMSAQRHGISHRTLTQQQRNTWLTDSEVRRLSEDESVLRIILRSWTSVRGGEPMLPANAFESYWVHRAVARCLATNAAYEAEGDSIWLIKAELLEQRLRRAWHLRGRDPQTLTTVARDRGFADFQAAVEASRRFFLGRTAPRPRPANGS